MPPSWMLFSVHSVSCNLVFGKRNNKIIGDTRATNASRRTVLHLDGQIFPLPESDCIKSIVFPHGHCVRLGIMLVVSWFGRQTHVCSMKADLQFFTTWITCMAWKDGQSFRLDFMTHWILIWHFEFMPRTLFEVFLDSSPTMTLSLGIK